MKNSPVSKKHWKLLQQHRKKISKTSLKKLFKEDRDRAKTFSIHTNTMLVDYSKNLVTEKTMLLLRNLASEQNLKKAIQGMYDGKSLNTTEKKPAFHIALRAEETKKLLIKNKNVVPSVRKVIDKMQEFVTSVREGEWKGYTEKTITDVVNIGIGGSDLGPKMVCKALSPYGRIITPHFVSNIDPTDIKSVLDTLNPETTLFVITSKTFTTLETIANAKTAKKWFLDKAKEESFISKHFVAVSASTNETYSFGIPSENVFEFWDWVGGRYSLWSSVGLPIALYMGINNFLDLLSGACEMDNHFITAPIKKNIPVTLALLDIWYNNFLGSESQAVVPYDQNLLYLPSYLQQLVMESNGKSVTKDGFKTKHHTGKVVWGGTGTNAQHSFFQLLHQGTRLIPVELLVATESQNPSEDRQSILVANCIAQSEALMLGRTESAAAKDLSEKGLKQKKVKSLAPHLAAKGNNPSTTIMYQKLTPHTLGHILAMYEHRVFVQGVIWNINSFDQWGVELGKALTKKIANDLTSDEEKKRHDSSTNQLIKYYRENREG